MPARSRNNPNVTEPVTPAPNNVAVVHLPAVMKPKIIVTIAHKNNIIAQSLLNIVKRICNKLKTLNTRQAAAATIEIIYPHWKAPTTNAFSSIAPRVNIAAAPPSKPFASAANADLIKSPPVADHNSELPIVF